MKKGLLLALVVVMAGAAVLGAQEGPPPPPEGLTFSGSVITGLRYRSYVGGTGYDVFDIDAGDDYLVEGDTAALRGTLNKGTYGANFEVKLNANNTGANFWTAARIYTSEASLWANLLDNKVGIKAGYFGDFDYFTPVLAYSLGPDGGTDAIQLTAYPIDGLRIDVRTRNSASNLSVGEFSAPVWYKGEQYIKNIDGGVKYTNPSFTTFVALDNTWKAAGPAPDETTQTDIFGYVAYTGVPKLTVSLEGKFFDVTSERKDSADATKDLGITIATAINASYQITDVFSARAWFIAGAGGIGGSLFDFGTFADKTKNLLGEDGFSFAVDTEFTYKLSDTVTFSLRPIFQIPDSEKMDIFDISVKPKVAWALASFPYAATINFWYMLRVYGKDGVAYAGNNNEALNHSIAATFGWTF
jgi:hypothetical protein